MSNLQIKQGVRVSLEPADGTGLGTVVADTVRMQLVGSSRLAHVEVRFDDDADGVTRWVAKQNLRTQTRPVRLVLSTTGQVVATGRLVGNLKGFSVDYPGCGVYEFRLDGTQIGGEGSLRIFGDDHAELGGRVGKKPAQPARVRKRAAVGKASKTQLDFAELLK